MSIKAEVPRLTLSVEEVPDLLEFSCYSITKIAVLDSCPQMVVHLSKDLKVQRSMLSLVEGYFILGQRELDDVFDHRFPLS